LGPVEPPPEPVDALLDAPPEPVEALLEAGVPLLEAVAPPPEPVECWDVELHPPATTPKNATTHNGLRRRAMSTSRLESGSC
jgi:hypothetical protein